MPTWLESSPGGNQRDMQQRLLLQQTLMTSYAKLHGERKEEKDEGNMSPESLVLSWEKGGGKTERVNSESL